MVAKKIKTELLGNTYNFCNLDYILGEIFSPVLNKQITLSHQNLHGLALALKDREFNDAIKNSDFSWVDGLPIIWMLKIAGYNISQSWRLTFLDWYQVFFDKANTKKSSIFLLSSTQESINKASIALESTYPDITFQCHHGYFNVDDDYDNQSVIQKINDAHADILIIGMGMPIQEKWVNAHKSRIKCNVIMPVGGFFDYLSNKSATPPRWLGKFGLEWLYRFTREPKRLFYRYFIEPVPVYCHFINDLIKLKKLNK